jgi:LPS sulfotransferase NodH
VANDRKWQAFFHEASLSPLVLTYEALCADYRGTILNVLNWLGIPDAASVRIRPPRFRKQSDEETEAWLGRYLEFRAAPNVESSVSVARQGLG